MPYVADIDQVLILTWKLLRAQDSRTPLHWAASGGHLDVVTYLLANGAEVDKADDCGWTPLHTAGRCMGLPHNPLLCRTSFPFSSQFWSRGGCAGAGGGARRRG